MDSVRQSDSQSVSQCSNLYGRKGRQGSTNFL